MVAPAFVRVALALAALASASSPEGGVEASCPPPSERPPLASRSCTDEPGARLHVGVERLIREALSDWLPHPGAAQLSVGFGGDGRVASICLDSASDEDTSRRIPALAARARELPPAPACLAGRRLDFAWASEIATDEDLHETLRVCRAEIRPLAGQIDWCRFHQHCPVTRVRELESEADRELRSCVLASVPLAMRAGISGEILTFLPALGRKPDPELAFRAYRVCGGLPRPADVIGCMDRHGWERVR
jgi:hypothetical protein